MARWTERSAAKRAIDPMSSGKIRFTTERTEDTE
jgi:hypothetical protein